MNENMLNPYDKCPPATVVPIYFEDLTEEAKRKICLAGGYDEPDELLIFGVTRLPITYVKVY